MRRVDLIEQTPLDLDDKIKKAIDRLQMFEPKEGYYLAFSGGKDSICIKELADMAEVKYDAHYNVTTVDPPELTRFIKHNHKDIIWDMPKMNMWSLIKKKKIPPTRLIRYCCDYLKEGGGEGRVVVTGVRWAESARRKNQRSEVEIITRSKSKKFLAQKEIFLNSDNDEKRRMLETCFQKKKRIVNPIIDWTEEDVWGFIKTRNLPYCSLYDEGFTRLGCVGCPLGGKKSMEREFERWPVFKKQYIKAFDEMVEIRRAEGKTYESWYSGQAVFDWWIEGKRKKKAEEESLQISLEDLEEDR